MNILCFTGGGAFGDVHARVLARVTDILPKIDVVAGTSAGAGAALCVAMGVDPATLGAFFSARMPEIFAGHGWRRFKPFAPKYDDAALNNALRSMFRNGFGGLRIPAFIPAHNLAAGTLKVFSSVDGADQQWAAWEVCRASMAAHTYFAPYRGFADGGLFANDPSMIALAGAVRVLGAKPEEIRMFSIGTGADAINRTDLNPRSRIAWLKMILRDALEGGSVLKERYAASAVLGDRYRAFEFPAANLAFDDPAVIPFIREQWAPEINLCADFLERHFV